MLCRDSIGEVNIDDFAMDFIKGNLPYGDYFKHLKVSSPREDIYKHTLIQA